VNRYVTLPIGGRREDPLLHLWRGNEGADLEKLLRLLCLLPAQDDHTLRVADESLRETSSETGEPRVSWKRGQKKGHKHSPCLRCGSVEEPTRHHVYPKRHFDPDGPTVPFCRKYHDKLEWLIPYAVQTYEFYWHIIGYFIDVPGDQLEMDLSRVQGRQRA